MTSATLPRPIALAVPIVFRGPVPEAGQLSWRPAVGVLVSDLRGPTPDRTPLQVPYGYGDRELFGYPVEDVRELT